MGALYSDMFLCSLQLLFEIFQHHISFVQHLFQPRSDIRQWKLFSKIYFSVANWMSVERNLCKFRSESFEWEKFWTIGPRSHEILTGLHFTGAFMSLRADLISGFLSEVSFSPFCFCRCGFIQFLCWLFGELSFSYWAPFTLVFSV